MIHRERVSVNFRAIHKCAQCKAVCRIEWEHSYTAVGGYYAQKLDHKWESSPPMHPLAFPAGSPPILQCRCGGKMPGKRIVGIVTEHECDARCMNSRGHQCECSCGGANHGKNLAPVFA